MGWDSPVKLPKWSKAEFQQLRKDYVAKHGYTIRVPDFEDIIKLPVENPITPEEEKQWKRVGHGDLTLERKEDIGQMKQRRKEKFLAMLGSPTPGVVQNIGSTMTFFDDLNDTLGTIGMVGKVAARMAPRMLGRLVTGPVGWVMAASDVVNLYGYLSVMPGGGKSAKRKTEGWTDVNPFSKKAKAKRAIDLKKGIPTKGNLIEALQTTENMFGIGLELGPIVGFIQDLGFGAWKKWKGADVKFTKPTPTPESYQLAPLRYLKGGGWGAVMGQELTDDEHMAANIALNISTQVVRPLMDNWNPCRDIENWEKITIFPPTPKNVLTLEIFEEAGIDPVARSGWPDISWKWCPLEYINHRVRNVGATNFRAYSARNQYNFNGFISGCNVTEFTENMVSFVAGKENVETDYIAAEKTVYKLLYDGWRFPPDIKLSSKRRFENMINLWEQKGDVPTTVEIVNMAKAKFRFEFTRKVPEKALPPLSNIYPEWA